MAFNMFKEAFNMFKEAFNMFKEAFNMFKEASNMASNMVKETWRTRLSIEIREMKK